MRLIFRLIIYDGVYTRPTASRIDVGGYDIFYNAFTIVVARRHLVFIRKGLLFFQHRCCLASFSCGYYTIGLFLLTVLLRMPLSTSYYKDQFDFVTNIRQIAAVGLGEGASDGCTSGRFHAAVGRLASTIEIVHRTGGLNLYQGFSVITSAVKEDIKEGKVIVVALRHSFVKSRSDFVSKASLRSRTASSSVTLTRS